MFNKGDDQLAQKLREGGKAAPALITASKPGKVVTSDDGVAQVVWKLSLRVSPPDWEPFNAVVKAPYPQKGGGPPVGSKVGVLYNTRDHSKIMIDQSAATESWGAVQADATAKVLQEGGAAGGLIIAGGQVISGGQGITPSAAAQPASLSDQLAKLADLKDRGVLTDAEFEDQKQKLLGT